MPNFTKTLNLEKPLRGEFYSIEKHNENSDKIDLAIAKITVPTIEHLKNMIELQDGDTVDLQGYYTAGDGAHHKRKIEATDDGSGVQLANGLWANIVFKSNETTITHWGAIPNTTFDNADIMQKIFDFCFGKVEFKNYNSLKVRVPVGSFALGRTLKISPRTSLVGVVSPTSRAIDLAHQSSSCFSALSGFEGKHFFDTANVKLSDGSRNVGLFPDMWEIFGGWKPRVYKPSGDIVLENLALLCQGRVGAFNFWGANMCRIENNNVVKALLPSVLSCSWGHTVKNNVFDSMFSGLQIKHITYATIDNNYFLQDTLGTTYDGVKQKLWGMYNYDKLTSGGGIAGARVGSALFFQNASCSVGTTYIEKHEVAISIHCLGESIDSETIYGGTGPTFTAKTNLEENGKGFLIRSELDLDLAKVGYYYVGTVAEAYTDNNIKIRFVAASAPKQLNYINNFTNWLKRTTKSTFFITMDEDWSFPETVAAIKNCNTIIGDDLKAKKNVIMDNRDISLYDFKTSKNYQSSFGFFQKNDSSGISIYNGFLGDGSGSFSLYNWGNNLAFKIIDGSGDLQPQKIIRTTESVYELLDTPYYTLKMQQEGIYEDFITYMDSKLEYEKQQRELEEQRQLAFEQRENQEQSYEEWLSTQPQLMPFAEPQPSQALLDFKEKYLG